MADDSSDSYSPLKSISRGASFFMVGKGLDSGLRFLLSIVLARGLTTGGNAVMFSVYTFGFVVIQFVEVLANLGTDQSILKFVPQYEDQPAKRRRMVGLAYLTSLIAGCAVGLGLYIGAPVITGIAAESFRPYLTDVLRVLAVIVPFFTLTSCIKSVFKSLELPEYQVFIMNVLTPVVRFALVGVALLLGYELVGVTAATVVATILVFVAAAWLVWSKTDLVPSFRASKGEVKEFYNFSLPLTLNQAGYVLSNRVDIIMIGIFVTSMSDAAGIYRAAAVLAGLLILPLSAFSQLFPPIASRLYSNGKMDDLESLYRRVTRWTFTMALFPAVGAVVFAHQLLLLYGNAFTQGEAILFLLVVAQLANASVGPSGYVLMMTDNQYLALANQWILGVCNVVLNYVFIQQFGLIGAAIATATVIISVNTLRVVEVWHFVGLFPYSRKYAKPIIAGVLSAVSMLGVKAAVGGPLSAHLPTTAAALAQGAVGGVVGLAVFAGVLYLLGIEREDREFVSENVPL